MRFLHTSDWHLGKTLKGHNRLREQSAVLEEIVGIVRQYEVDAVLIAGDICDFHRLTEIKYRRDRRALWNLAQVFGDHSSDIFGK